ncbi:MAG: polysaccharide pyruvyl transferase family protein [Bacteroidota bacterium]
MKKILIKNFKNLNNYGSGMMGLITIKKVYERLNGEAEFYSDFDEYANLEDILRELDGDIKLNVFKEKIKKPPFSFLTRFYNLYNITSNSQAKEFDLVIILGGDDLSEYYGIHVWPLFVSYYSWSFKTKVILLGQSIGPFNFWLNRLTFKRMAKRCKIFTRDKYCFDYLQNDLGIQRNMVLSGDLAFLDLPLQHDTATKNDVLKKYGLQSGEYVCLVISGLVGKYYTKSVDEYFTAYRKLIKDLKSLPGLGSKKICLLAHTFPPHGDEAKILEDFKKFLQAPSDDLVFIQDKVLQASARFILGNGMFTISGRMHASISTFQMGKPSISLSYSVKYRGVIGDNLGRNDLIIEANKPKLWATGEINSLILDKVKYVLQNYSELTEEISSKVLDQKTMVNSALDQTVSELG